MTVVILGEAEREFAESVAYYEANGAGLGRHAAGTNGTLLALNRCS